MMTAKLTEAAWFSLATAVFQGSRLLVNLVAAATLGPATFGVWVLIQLVLQYSTLLTLGVPNAAGREIPMSLGARRKAHADDVEGVTVTVTLLSAMVGAVVAAALAVWVVSGPDPPEATLVILIGAAVATQQLFVTTQILARSRFRFGVASVQLAGAGAIFLVAGLGLLPLGPIGLTAALVVAQAVPAPLGLIRSHGRPRLAWDPMLARRLVNVGLPIMLAGFAFIGLTTVDRWLVAAFLGTEAVGVYGVATLASSGLLLIATVLGQQFLPRMAFAHGSSASAASLLDLARRQGRITFATVGVAATLVVVVSWLVLPALADAYLDARLPLTVLAAGVVAYTPSAAFGNLLNVTGRQRDYLSVQVLAIALNTALCASAIALGLGLVGVAGAVALTLALYAVLLRRRADIAVRGLEPGAGVAPASGASAE